MSQTVTCFGELLVDMIALNSGKTTKTVLLMYLNSLCLNSLSRYRLCRQNLAMMPASKAH